jgi:hypothetical protein
MSRRWCKKTLGDETSCPPWQVVPIAQPCARLALYLTLVVALPSPGNPGGERWSGKPPWEPRLREASEFWQACRCARSVQIVKEDVKGDLVHVEYTLHASHGAGEREKVELRKVTAHWKILLLNGDK